MAKKIEQKGTASIKVIVDKPKPKKAPGHLATLNKGRGRHVPKDNNGLTELEARFVEYYTISWNKAEAVRNAGYQCQNPTSQALDLLAKPKIKELVEEKRKAFRERTSEIRDQLTAALEQSAFYDYNEFFELKEVSRKVGSKIIKEVVPVFKTTDALERGAGKLISSMKIGKDHRVEIKLDDKHAARQLLAEHIGFKELDNIQKRNDAVAVYIPDNNRGDVIDSQAKAKES